MAIQKSKTAVGERIVPLTLVACSALSRLQARAELFGPVEPAHFVFAAFTSRFTFSVKKVVGYSVTGFDRSGTLTARGGRSRERRGSPSFRFHDLRHCAITSLAESGAAATIMAIAGHVSRRMLERYSHVRMEAKRTAAEAFAKSTGRVVTTQTVTQTAFL